MDKQMKILVTGANGQVGQHVCMHLAKNALCYKATDLPETDLTKVEQVEALFAKEQPDAVIHCAAYTAVDRAENEPEQCFFVNHTGTANVVSSCVKYDASLLYLSTDYVFDGSGEKPWETMDQTNPLNVYGKSKLAGENEILAYLQKFFIVRTSWVFGLAGNNFFKTIIRLGKEKDCLSVINDQIGSPTYADDLADLLVQMIQTKEYGLYHATNEGDCSWYEFSKQIIKISESSCKVIPVTSDEYKTDARRPKNSRLSKQSLDVHGFKRLPTWSNALVRCVCALANTQDQ